MKASPKKTNKKNKEIINQKEKITKGKAIKAPKKPLKDTHPFIPSQEGYKKSVLDFNFPLIKDSFTKKIVLLVLLIASILIYLVLLFWNIPYPLLWADEGMTTMHAERVLQFGYPKISDGKNVLYDLEHPDLNLGRDKKTDAFVGGTGWLHYYFAAPFVSIANGYTDFYTKTTILRTAFAIIGTFGLMLFILSLLPLFKNYSQKLTFSIIFIIICIFSVPLLLHLREVRYYSLTIFLYGAILFIFSYHRIYGRFNKYIYLLALTILLLLNFFSFSPAYFIITGIIATFELLNFLFFIYYQKKAFAISVRSSFNTYCRL